jgi:hypothetical protein
MAWKGIVARSCSPDGFDAYVLTQSWTSWKPSFIALHNTAAPSLAQRPNGLTLQHIRNLEGYYRDDRGWPSGPHLFIDDHQIWVFTPLTTPGTHSPSWNSSAIGIEMLGDFDSESFTSGRGLKVRQNTVRAMAALSRRLGFKHDAWKFHIEDPRTTHGCPGKLARNERAKLQAEIKAAMGGKVATNPDMTPPPWGKILPDDFKME